MNILQVLTLVAPGNPFGGPVSVAANQTAELRRRGHRVDLVAGQPSRRARGAWSSDVASAFSAWQVVPGAGFSGLVSPGLVRHARSRLADHDVVHVHLSRDLVTLPVAALARRRGVPYVLQMHGMVDPSSKRSAAVLDAVLTRRVIEGAARVLVLTDRERHDVEAVMRRTVDTIEVLHNGVPVPEGVSPFPAGAPVLLFCSRLHVRKRPVAFVRAAVAMVRAGVDARFRVVGADEGELGAVRGAIGVSPVEVVGAVEPAGVPAEIDAAHVLVLPSVDEPFPMVVIEAMSRGRAVVVTESCGLASFVREHGAGIVVASDEEAALLGAMTDLALDRGRIAECGARGARAVRSELAIGPVVDRLEACYRDASRRR